MTECFVDTSGFYALFDGTDPRHGEADAAFRYCADQRVGLLTTNYVVHETWALVQARLGWAAVEAWERRLLTACETVWVDAGLHELGAARCRQARRRHLSLTDCISLETMYRRGIDQAIAFDVHFDRAGIRRPA